MRFVDEWNDRMNILLVHGMYCMCIAWIGTLFLINYELEIDYAQLPWEIVVKKYKVIIFCRLLPILMEGLMNHGESLMNDYFFSGKYYSVW